MNYLTKIFCTLPLTLPLIFPRNLSRTVLLILTLVAGGVVLFSGCGGDECADQSCACSTASDCPDSFQCYDNACYKKGQYQVGNSCTKDTQCDGGKSLTCLEIGVCANSCATESNSCHTGWACHTAGKCYPEHSLPEGSACAMSLLCEGTTQCVAGNCVQPCTTGYTLNQCNEGRYCQVFDTPTCKPPQPTCDPSAAVDVCPQAPTVKNCIDLGANFGLCARPCDYTVSASGFYSSSSCDARGMGNYQATCAPIGVNNDAICIEAARGGGFAGSSCNGGTSLCAQGNICASGVCRKLCGAQYSCAGGLSCQTTAGAFKACM